MVLMISGMLQISVRAAALSPEDETGYKQGIVMLIENLTAFTEEEIAANRSQFTEAIGHAVDSWQEAKAVVGSYVEVGEQSVEVADSGDILITSQVSFEKGTATVSVALEVIEGVPDIVSMTFQVNTPTIRQRLEQMNPVLLLGIIVILLTALLIVLLKGNTGRKDSDKKAAQEEMMALAIAASMAVSEDRELVNNHELVAVITAAIAALENAPADGFRVRSIKRVHSLKWKKS